MRNQAHLSQLQLAFSDTFLAHFRNSQAPIVFTFTCYFAAFVRLFFETRCCVSTSKKSLFFANCENSSLDRHKDWIVKLGRHWLSVVWSENLLGQSVTIGSFKFWKEAKCSFRRIAIGAEWTSKRKFQRWKGAPTLPLLWRWCSRCCRWRLLSICRTLPGSGSRSSMSTTSTLTSKRPAKSWPGIAQLN